MAKRRSLCEAFVVSRDRHDMHDRISTMLEVVAGVSTGRSQAAQPQAVSGRLAWRMIDVREGKVPSFAGIESQILLSSSWTLRASERLKGCRRTWYCRN